MEERKLASVRTVSEITQIDGADSIESATIDGWNCVVKKGEFKPGDLCIYFEIDSFLPVKPEFEFLRKSCYKKMADGREGFRLKTIRLRGTLSQGLALNLSILNRTDVDSYQGEDVTEILGVTKYEQPIPAQLQGVCKGTLPSFLRKTDQERVQNIWNKVKDCDDTFEVTLKLDGTSCTFYLYEDKFGVCSRNMDLVENENNTLWKIAKRYDIEGTLRKIKEELGLELALQGEVIGEGIQGNREELIGQDFFLFDIWYIVGYSYMPPPVRHLFYTTYLEHADIKHIPVIECFKKLNSFENIKDVLEYADGPSINNSVREGVVFRTNCIRKYDSDKFKPDDISFKVISNKFLLEEK